MRVPTSRDVTICLAYYENAGMLQVQYENLARMPENVREHISLVVVDDGSPKAPARPPSVGLGLSLQIYRMREDIPWNQDACRNLAVDRAATKWVLLTDMDHVPSEALLRRVVQDEGLNGANVYTFRRVNAPNKEPYKPHPNSWLMTKAMYDKIGGYDERYRGVYGTDGEFKRGVERCARRILECKEALIRYPREVVADASTTTYERKSPENERLRKQRRSEILSSNEKGPKRFLMEWDRVC